MSNPTLVPLFSQKNFKSGRGGFGAQGATGGTVNPSATPGYTIHTFTWPGTFTTNAAIAATYSIN